MHRYIPNSGEVKEQMLKDMGLSSIEDLFSDIPKNLRYQGNLNIDPALSEMELLKKMEDFGKKNQPMSSFTSFLGAGVYDHFVPLLINHIASRSEFYTAYTPYQAEISQGTLQVIFEYQSMICELTGMDTSNASMYDGANAAVEGVLLALNNSKSNRVLISEGMHPEVHRVIKTYLKYRDTELIEVPLKDGRTDLDKAEELLEDKTACFILQNPNFYGGIEDMKRFSEITEKTISIAHVDPISLALFEAPGKLGIDIVVGDGQSLGNGINLGGPYLGFMAVGKKLLRKMPGRVAGLTKDSKDQRAFTLTLQAREQHIRRYKATSNICSNQALNALISTVYLTVMGKQGLREVALQAHSKAKYLYKALVDTGKFEPCFDAPFFKEFCLKYQGDLPSLMNKLKGEGFLAGFALEDNKLLVAVTEKRTKDEMDAFVDIVRRLG